MVYDELFETAVGALDMDRALNPALWDSILSRGGRTEALDPRDKDDPAVIHPAKDLYDAFVDELDDVPLLPPVPEGDGADDSFSPHNNRER